MINISISEEMSSICPNLQVLAIGCDVKNTKSDPTLWEEITLLENNIKDTFKIEDVNKWLPIQSTRQAYKKLGKDPNRYRPSAEALYRRILRGLPLYKIDTLVDLVNYISIKTGYSIGAFDVDKIQGDALTLGVGVEGELYNGIGRGELNIAGLPVYRDLIGGIGTPTSDEERTKIDINTTHLLMIVNGYDGLRELQDVVALIEKLLTGYVSAGNLEIKVLPSSSYPERVLNMQ